MYTTLAELKAAGACAPSYKALCKALGGADAYGRVTPLPYIRILELNGLSDCLWALAHGDAESLLVCRLAALAFAQRVERYTDDTRVKDCNRITHLYLHGEATEEELAAAQAAAEAAAEAAARAAARAAAWAALHAAWAALHAAGEAWVAAGAAEYQAQITILRDILTQCEGDQR
jgi:hypothetical protein